MTSSPGMLRKNGQIPMTEFGVVERILPNYCTFESYSGILIVLNIGSSEVSEAEKVKFALSVLLLTRPCACSEYRAFKQ